MRSKIIPQQLSKKHQGSLSFSSAWVSWPRWSARRGPGEGDWFYLVLQRNTRKHDDAFKFFLSRHWGLSLVAEGRQLPGVGYSRRAAKLVKAQQRETWKQRPNICVVIVSIQRKSWVCTENPPVSIWLLLKSSFFPFDFLPCWNELCDFSLFSGG